MRLGVEAALVESKLLLGDVEIADGRIEGYGLPSPNGRGIAAPGFVDLQVNGFGGADFLDADGADYARAGEALLETGVTAYLPTFITAPETALVDALRRLSQQGGHGPRILGAHLEGPFLSPSKLGAHSARDRLDPDVELVARLLRAGPIAMMTVAPELPGALELVPFLRQRGVVVSCGHTDATSMEAHRAFDAGATTVTHLFNAMRPLGHRDPGIIGAALVRTDVVIQIIVDGVHLAPEVVQVVWHAAGGRVALVTDAISAAGAGDGSFAIGGIPVEVRDGVARTAGDGVLAGSVLTMIDAVRNLHALGIALESALGAAATVPARVLGPTAGGQLTRGAPADVVVLNDRLEIERVIVGGKARVSA